MTFRHCRTGRFSPFFAALIFALVACLIVPVAMAADEMFSSPFGIGGCHVRNRHAADNVTWVPQMAAIGLHVFRTPHAGWGDLEPEEGKWRWDDFDKQMQYLQDQKFEFGVL